MTPELDRRTFIKVAGATAVIIACGGAGQKATGRISIYSALNESTNNQLFAAFTKATGVEVSVLPLAAAGDLQTKITAEKNNVDESKLTMVAKSADVQPGATGGATGKLEAGNYLVFCNVPGHYAAGQHTVFTVTKS